MKKKLKSKREREILFSIFMGVLIAWPGFLSAESLDFNLEGACGQDAILSDSQKDLLLPVVSAGHLFCVNLPTPAERRACMGAMSFFVSDLCQAQEENQDLLVPVAAMIPGLSEPFLNQFFVSDLCQNQQANRDLLVPVIAMAPGFSTPFLNQFLVSDLCQAQEDLLHVTVPMGALDSVQDYLEWGRCLKELSGSEYVIGCFI